MPRATWSGAISFGLVNVPVKAYTAVRDHEVHFNQLDPKGARIRYQKVSERTGKVVESDDIKLGYEVAKNRYVTFEQEEIDALRPKTTRTVDVADFVALDEIDPVYYERTYWLAPDGEAAAKAYRLLLAAMEDRGRVGIGTVVMRNKQYLAAVRPLDGALAMSTMRFADEVVPQSAIDDLPSSKAKPEAKEMRLATQIVDALASDWDPERYHDTYTEELRDLIERKAEGEEVVVEEAPAAKAEIVDLLAALEASVQAARKARGGDVGKEIAKAAERLREEAAGEEDEDAGEAPARKAPAEKSAARKSTARKPAARKSTARKPAAKKAPARRRSSERKSA